MATVSVKGLTGEENKKKVYFSQNIKQKQTT